MASLRNNLRPFLAARSALLAGFLVLAAHRLPRLWTGPKLLPRLPLRRGRQPSSHPGKVQPGHSRAKRPHLHQLPRRRRIQLRSRPGHEPQGWMEGQDRSQADSAVVRLLPLQPGSDAHSTTPACAPISLTSTTPAFTASASPAGDTKVAVCIDCHSVHDIRPPSDPRSTVNPVNVAKTCSRCHSDAAYMKSVRDSHRSVCQVQHQRPPRRTGDARRPERAHLHHLPRQPWRRSARRRQGSERLRQLPRLPGPDVRRRARTARPLRIRVFPAASSATAITASIMPSDAMLGTGPGGVCMRCHAPGDHCDRARASILTDLTTLDQAINGRRPGSPSRRVLRHGSQRGSPQPGPGARRAHQGPRHHPHLPARPGRIRTFRPA